MISYMGWPERSAKPKTRTVIFLGSSLLLDDHALRKGLGDRGTDDVLERIPSRPTSGIPLHAEPADRARGLGTPCRDKRTGVQIDEDQP